MQEPIPGQDAPRTKEFFVYSVSFASLANGTDQTKVINVEADSWFMIQKLTFTADLAAAAQTRSTTIVPLVSVLITDTGSGRQLMDNAIPIPALCGNGMEPFILPTPKVFKPRSSISVKVSNYSAATTYNIYLVLSGSKLWY